MSMQEPPAELVQEMYAYYQTGKSLAQVGRKFHYTAPGVGKMFRRYGLPTRDTDYPPYCGIITLYRSMEVIMPNKKGQFQKGERFSPATEFKKGEHWRDEKPFWNYDWLYSEYVDKKRSSLDIAAEFGVTDRAIIFWLKKLNIPRRSMKEIRAVKKWGLKGEMNGMFGRTGALNPHWKGGVTPERQALYSSQEWARAVQIVWKRDNHTCQRCGKRWTRTHKLIMHIHHIVSFSVKELRTEPTNLILLCEPCHDWVHSKANKDHEFIRDK